MKIGDIDVVNSILNLEGEIFTLQQALDFITKKNSSNLKMPTRKDVQRFRGNANEMLMKKYPNMGITLKKSK